MTGSHDGANAPLTAAEAAILERLQSADTHGEPRPTDAKLAHGVCSAHGVSRIVKRLTEKGLWVPAAPPAKPAKTRPVQPKHRGAPSRRDCQRGAIAAVNARRAKAPIEPDDVRLRREMSKHDARVNGEGHRVMGIRPGFVGPAPRGCQWIEADPKVDASKCGAPVTRFRDGRVSAYCGIHHRRCYEPAGPVNQWGLG